MKLAIAIVLWAACGLYAWGTTMAYFDYLNRTDWAAMHWTSKHHARLCLVEATIGPMGALVAAIGSNFNQHGWQLWERR